MEKLNKLCESYLITGLIYVVAQIRTKVLGSFSKFTHIDKVADYVAHMQSSSHIPDDSFSMFQPQFNKLKEFPL